MEIVTIGLNRLKMKLFGANAVAIAEVTRVLQAFGRRMEGQIKARVPVATGRLRASIKYAVVQQSNRTLPVLKIGSMQAAGGQPVVYARFREFGGTITAKRTQYLAWAFKAKGFRNPLVTKAGVTGVRASSFGSAELGPGNVFGIIGTFVQPKAKGTPTKVMFAKFQGGGYMPLYVLAKQVKQKGSHYLYPVVDQNVPVIGKAIAIAIAKSLKG